MTTDKIRDALEASLTLAHSRDANNVAKMIEDALSELYAQETAEPAQSQDELHSFEEWLAIVDKRIFNPVDNSDQHLLWKCWQARASIQSDPVSDEQILKLLHDLSMIGCEFNCDGYGLPLGRPELLAKMLVRVRALLTAEPVKTTKGDEG